MEKTTPPHEIAHQLIEESSNTNNLVNKSYSLRDKYKGRERNSPLGVVGLEKVQIGVPFVPNNLHHKSQKQIHSHTPKTIIGKTLLWMKTGHNQGGREWEEKKEGPCRKWSNEREWSSSSPPFASPKTLDDGFPSRPLSAPPARWRSGRIIKCLL